MFVLGVIVGIIGLLGMGVNYPIYKKLLAQGKQKYAFEIMELAKKKCEKLPANFEQDIRNLLNLVDIEKSLESLYSNISQLVNP